MLFLNLYIGISKILSIENLNHENEAKDGESLARRARRVVSRMRATKARKTQKEL